MIKISKINGTKYADVCKWDKDIMFVDSPSEDLGEFYCKRIFVKEKDVGKFYENSSYPTLFLDSLDLEEHNLHNKAYGTRIIEAMKIYLNLRGITEDDYDTPFEYFYIFCILAKDVTDVWHKKIGFQYKDKWKEDIELFAEYRLMYDVIGDTSNLMFLEVKVEQDEE